MLILSENKYVKLLRPYFNGVLNFAKARARAMCLFIRFT